MSYLHPLHVASTVESVAVAEAAVEHVVEAVAAVSEEATQVVRRALQQTGTYPSPPSPELVSLPPAPVGFEYVAQDVQLSFTATDVPPWCNPEDGSISTDGGWCKLLLPRTYNGTAFDNRLARILRTPARLMPWQLVS